VAIHVARTASAFEIRVEDDGPGLASDHPGEIRPFYSTRPGGLGLGLAFARKIMVLHGGDLSLARGGTRGVVVRLTLPAAAGTAAS
jgi:signal transduction histidine kinase